MLMFYIVFILFFRNFTWPIKPYWEKALSNDQSSDM